MSPRRIGGSIGPAPGAAGRRWRLRVFTIQELELRCLQILQELRGIAPAGRIVASESPLALERLASRDGFADQLSGERCTRLPLTACVAREGTRRAFIECQIQTLHDTQHSTANHSPKAASRRDQVELARNDLARTFHGLALERGPEPPAIGPASSSASRAAS